MVKKVGGILAAVWRTASLPHAGTLGSTAVGVVEELEAAVEVVAAEVEVGEVVVEEAAVVAAVEHAPILPFITRAKLQIVANSIRCFPAIP